MNAFTRSASLLTLVLLVSCNTPDAGSPTVAEAEALPSWNDGAAKQSILDFVSRVTDENSPDFVPEEERIATFDNDGCMWAENPLYFQLIFVMDRVRAMASEHPDWQDKQPFKAVLENDRESLAGMGHRELGQLLAATHAGITAEEFSAIARDWLDTARHPRFDRPYDRCIYQPMVEVMEHLRANGFKTFIVSGGGIEFIRTFAPQAYGVPKDQVIGSSIETEFRTEGARSQLMRLPELHFNDDKAGKPVAINRYIGSRPIASFGNSDGDLQMLQYATGSERPGLAVIVHHDDAEREYAYDRESHIGRLDKALDEAEARGWTVVSMREDWMRVFPEK